MASRSELEAQAAAQAQVVAAAWASLQIGWAELELTSSGLQTASGLRAVQELFADIVSAWGEVAGTIAADFYDDLREQADVGGLFDALVPDPLNQDQVDAIVRWAIATATPPAPDPFMLPESNDQPTPSVDDVLAKLEGSTQRLVRQAQRTTIEQAARLDPAPQRVRVARVPMGAETCAFCLVVASRGYVYRSEASAGGLSPENRFHDFCDCEQDVSWSADHVPPDGYDPGELYATYEQAAAAAGTKNLRKILAELRRQEGIR